MEKNALKKLSYGIYIISSKNSGCVVNSLVQVTNSPLMVAVAVNRESYTNMIIKENKYFNVTVAGENVSMDIIRTFGFSSSRNTDKFAKFRTSLDSKENKYVYEGMSSLLECEVVTEIEAGAHTLFVANVIGAKVLSENAPMTYDYYLNVKNGVTPPKAVSYTENERKGFRCPICGYIHESDDLPNDFACPICGAPGSLFEKINN